MRIYKKTITEHRYFLNKAGDLFSFLADSRLVENISVHYEDDDCLMVDHIDIIVELNGFRKDFYERNNDCSWVDAAYGVILETNTGSSTDRKILFKTSLSSIRGKKTFDSNDLAQAGSIKLRNPVDVLDNIGNLSQCCDAHISREDDRVIIVLTPLIKNYTSDGRYSLIGD